MNQSKLLLASVALNVFLAAFTLGRLSALPSLTAAGNIAQPGPGMPPPPPMFGPQDVFGPEGAQDMKEAQAHFARMNQMRQDFAAKLKAGPVTKEDVVAHLSEIDTEMDAMKNSMKEKAAEKIAGMKEDERQAFAKRLLEKGPPMRFDGGPHDGPMGGPPGFRGPPPGGPPPDGMFGGPPPPQ